MRKYLLDRETVLDLSVNIVSLVILLLFFLLFLLHDPFHWAPEIVIISLGLLIIPFAFLALITYFAGRAIERGERRLNT